MLRLSFYFALNKSTLFLAIQSEFHINVYILCEVILAEAKNNYIKGFGRPTHT